MKKISLVGLTAVKVVGLLGREPAFWLSSYGKEMALVLKPPKDETEFDKLVARVKDRLYRKT